MEEVLRSSDGGACKDLPYSGKHRGSLSGVRWRLQEGWEDMRKVLYNRTKMVKIELEDLRGLAGVLGDGVKQGDLPSWERS